MKVRLSEAKSPAEAFLEIGKPNGGFYGRGSSEISSAQKSRFAVGHRVLRYLGSLGIGLMVEPVLRYSPKPGILVRRRVFKGIFSDNSQ